MIRPVIIAALMLAVSGSGVVTQAKPPNHSVPPPPKISRQNTPVVRVPPQYPRNALQSRQSGWVLVEFTITEDGRVTHAHVLRSTHRIFERSALHAILRWRYRPAVVNGEAVRVEGVREVIVFDADKVLRRRIEATHKELQRRALFLEWRYSEAQRTRRPNGTSVKLPSGRRMNVLGPWITTHSQIDLSALDGPELEAKDFRITREFRCHVLLDPSLVSAEVAATLAEELLRVHVTKKLEKLEAKEKEPIRIGVIRFIPEATPDGGLVWKRVMGKSLPFKFERNDRGQWRRVN